MRNTIRFDWAIKRLLRNKANYNILEGFLSELLKTDIKITSLLESESNQQTATNKMNRVDLMVQNTKGELMIIEVQSDYTQDYLMRILFGISKLIVDTLDKGAEYRQIKKVISINIVYFDLGHGVDYVYRGCTNFKGIHHEDDLLLSAREQAVFQAKEIADIYPEIYLIKVNNFNAVAENELDEWIRFLKTEEIKDNTTAKGLKEAKKQIDILKLDKEAMMAYESDEDAWRDYASSMSTSFTSGKIEGKIEVAINCLRSGMPVEQISTITGLPLDEIRNLPI